MKRVLILSDTLRLDKGLSTKDKIVPIQIFTKNASGLRLTNQIRKYGVEVKPIYNFSAFSIDEYDSIFKTFTENKTHELVVSISTSFIGYGIIKNKNPDEIISGIDIWGDNYQKILLFCKLAKTKYNATIVMGGWAVKTATDTFKNAVDVFVTGDGSEIIAKLAGAKITLTGKMINKKEYLHYISPAITDFSDQGSAPLLIDHINPQESLTTELASGCIFSCSFCNYGSLGKKKHEFVRSYESLKSEIESNYNNFGTTLYLFTDNIMNDYAPKLEMLVKIKDELGIDLRWTGYVRLDTIKNISQVQLLKDSGIVGATFGIESFCKTAGPYIGKMTDGERIKDHLRMFREVVKDDCIVTTSLIAGLPTETPEMFIKTYEYLTSEEGHHLVDSSDFSRLILFENQGTKNEINKARMNGDPFYQYIKKDAIDWSSPWGTSRIFEDIANKFIKKGIKNNLLGYAFNLPFLHNSGIGIEKTLYHVRNNINFLPEDIKNFQIQNQKNIEHYKQQVLND